MRRSLVIALSLAAFLTVVPAAGASPGSAVIKDCQQHQKLTRHYTTAQLENALQIMPAQVQEYTDCEQVIQNALNHPSGANNGGSGGGGSFLPTPVIVILVLLILAALTFGALELRRRQQRT